MPAKEESELLAYLSHEVRTGLHAMVGHAQLLQLDGLPKQDALSVERIIDTGFYLVGLLEEVAELAESELGVRDLIELEPIPVEPLLNQLIALVGPLASAQGTRIEIDEIGPGAEGVRADRRRLTQVLLNLLSNAIKYGGSGGGPVRLSATRSEDRVALCVSDSGPGIDPNRLRDLFEPFERLGAETGPAPGSGIGLALSKRIAASTGAELTLERTSPTGTTFLLRLLPLSDYAPDATRAATSS
jgi:signal transduction histidine kinase